MAKSAYNAQCFAGHVLVVDPDSVLEKLCEERAASGRLDAFILGPDDCPECIEDLRDDRLRMSGMCVDFGCMFSTIDNKRGPDCRPRCMSAKDYDEIKDSPYEGQLRLPPPVRKH